MSILARHRYIISRLTDAFEMPDDKILEMMTPEVLKSINYFFSADGPTRIVVAVEVTGTSHNKIKIYTRDVENLSSSAVYFMKTKRGKDNDDHYALDPTKANDGGICFGVIRNPLESLEVVMRCVYKPMIQDMGLDTWGQASEEQRHEFVMSIEGFSKGLQDSIRSLSGGLDLRKPDEMIENLGMAALGDPNLITNAINLLQEWCRNIEHYLNDTDRSRWETPDSGPDTELEYWRSRMQR